ncbi:MAG TPA: RCC1 repeat-containing protein [Anaeromyxobacteraceae bacterium]|nr:RCC1 repeat-containing protein [Anaeromyxobacteraceae bacterium]
MAIGDRTSVTLGADTVFTINCTNAAGSDSAQTTVAAIPAAAAQVALGLQHSCALLDGGAVRCWGANESGELGDGTTTDRASPVEVALGAAASQIAAGSRHACALVSGGVKCWGANNRGQLGDGTTTGRSAPVDVSGLPGVLAISAGSEHTCALLSTGTVRCWGANSSGQLGNGTTFDSHVPVGVVGLGSTATAIAAGGLHGCALLSGGDVKCWGNNLYGQLGDGTFTTYQAIAVSVSALGAQALSLAAGSTHTCAVLSGGGASCWGGNASGQVGNGTTDAHAPRAVLGLASSVASLSAGLAHTCALYAGGGAACWGSDQYGQLGERTLLVRNTPVDVGGLTSGVAAVAAGGYHSCAAVTGGAVRCWGRNEAGQLGDGSVSLRATPAAGPDLGGPVSWIAAGYNHSCAVGPGGAAICWGYNFDGELGNGETVQESLPTGVSGLGSGVVAVAGGRLHSCALLAGGAVDCWGYNLHEQLGDGTNADKLTPVQVSGLTSGVVALAAGGEHTCALLGTGGAKCWGLDNFGQRGDASAGGPTPTDVSGLTSGVAALAAGDSHTCALLTDGEIKC